MNTPLPACPECSTSDPVLKLSQIYVAMITEAKSRSDDDRRVIAQVFGEAETGSDQLRQTLDIRRGLADFGPPSGSQRIIRPVHPDLAMGALGVISVVFLYNMAASQPGALIPAAVILLAVVVAYLFLRRRLLNDHRGRLEKVEREKSAVKGQVTRWMDLYYCCDDGIVFDPKRGVSAAIEEIGTLYR